MDVKLQNTTAIRFIKIHENCILIAQIFSITKCNKQLINNFVMFINERLVIQV